MAQQDDWPNIAARCRACGAIYSAWMKSKGSIQLIGRKDGCQCGASEFHAIS